MKKKRVYLINRINIKLSERVKASAIFALSTFFILFLLDTPAQEREQLRDRVEELEVENRQLRQSFK